MTAAPAAPQDLSIWIDATASHARPPAGVAGDPSSYALLGGRFVAEVGDLDLSLGGRSGNALGDQAGGQWLQGDVVVRAGRRVGPASLRFTASGFGLHYIEPFAYDAGGVDTRPELSLYAGHTAWTFAPRLVIGRWAADSLDGRLWIGGGGVDVQRGFGPVIAATRLELLDVENGVTSGLFVRGGAGASYARGRWTLLAEVQAQRSPLETELGGVVSASAAITDALAVRLEGGRYLRDPLFGAAASVGLSAGVSVRPVRLRAPRAAPVAAVGATRDGTRSVRFTLRAPGAERVEISGDFTAWEPRPMERSGDRWMATLELEPGLHHFGFLVDDQWTVPAEAPGRVDDGWGRVNASIVVEP